MYGKYSNRCDILTGVPKRGITDVGKDKVKWMHRLLVADIKVNIVYREEKPQYCTCKACILIDDMESNIRDWNEYGGTGIKNVSADETMGD